MKERLAGIEGRLRCIEYVLERETEGKLSQHMKMNLRLEIDNILDSPENSIGNSEDIDACSLDSRIGRVPVIHNMRIEFESPAKEGAICDNSSNMKKSNSKPPCLTHDVRSSTSTSTSTVTGIEFPSPPDNNDAGNIADHSYMSTYVLDYISYCHSWLYDYWSDKPKP